MMALELMRRSGIWITTAARRIRSSPAGILLIVTIMTAGLGLSALMVSIISSLNADPLRGNLSHDIKDLNVSNVNGINLLNKEQASFLSSQAAPTNLILVGQQGHTSVSLENNQEPTQLTFAPVNREFFRQFSIPIKYGDFWSKQVDDEGLPQLVIRESVALRLFGKANAVGLNLRVGGAIYTVVGVIREDWHPKPKFYAVDGGYSDAESIYIPLLSLGLFSDKNSSYIGFQCVTPPGETPVLPWPGNIASSGCSWITAYINTKNISNSKLIAMSDGLRAFTNGKLNIDPISIHDELLKEKLVPTEFRTYEHLALLLYMLCVCYSMGILVSRFFGATKEIGIHRALGATRMDIWMSFWIESIAANAISSLLGMIVVIGGLFLIHYIPSDIATATKLNINAVCSSLMLAFASATISAAAPAGILALSNISSLLRGKS